MRGGRGLFSFSSTFLRSSCSPQEARTLPLFLCASVTVAFHIGGIRPRSWKVPFPPRSHGGAPFYTRRSITRLLNLGRLPSVGPSGHRLKKVPDQSLSRCGFDWVSLGLFFTGRGQAFHSRPGGAPCRVPLCLRAFSPLGTSSFLEKLDAGERYKTSASFAPKSSSLRHVSDWLPAPSRVKFPSSSCGSPPVLADARLLERAPGKPRPCFAFLFRVGFFRRGPPQRRTWCVFLGTIPLFSADPTEPIRVVLTSFSFCYRIRIDVRHLRLFLVLNLVSSPS